ncbi:MAG: alpha/beta hydrolase [Betaproteobacteria bacterium]|nr:alpha/beta hydrolase [Betaproteobacteria bacterium]
MKAVLFIAIAAYVGICAFLWFAQERLIFLGAPPDTPPTAPPGWRMERFDLEAPDGAKLEGYIAHPPVERPAVVLYFGGNAEEATHHLKESARLYGPRAVVAVNYRGYGRSTGKPGEAVLVADALLAYDRLLARTDLDTGRIAVHGRSLGSGIAVALAGARPVKALVLTTPFDSLTAVARGQYPWAPVGLLLRHRFDSISRAPELRHPVLVVSAAGDDVIPPAHADRLAAAWGGTVQALRLPHRGHNDLFLDPLYGPAIAAFLDRRL